MNSLLAQMLGKKPSVREDVPVPVGVPRSQSGRGRDRRSVQRRSAAAAMLGLGEAEDDEESIIPADAEDIDTIAGPSGIKMDDKAMDQDRQPDEPAHPDEASSAGDSRLLSPRDALVAPDVTPQAMEPIDASEVPPARNQQPEQSQVPRFVPSAASNQVNPMDVLLGRTSTRPSKPEPQPEQVMTAEAAQAMASTMLNTGGVSGEALLKPKEPMPDPTPGDASKIMEAFNKYGPARSWNF